MSARRGARLFLLLLGATSPRPGAEPKPKAALRAGSSGSFASRVLKVVRAIPRGKVASYGQCAALAGSPNKARQVGKLLRASVPVSLFSTMSS